MFTAVAVMFLPRRMASLHHYPLEPSGLLSYVNRHTNLVNKQVRVSLNFIITCYYLILLRILIATDLLHSFTRNMHTLRNRNICLPMFRRTLNVAGSSKHMREKEVLTFADEIMAVVSCTK